MESLDFAIVGGGVIGWSAAYHIAAMESRAKIAVFERNSSSAMGATSLAAGGVRAQFGTDVNVRLSLHSISFFEQFEERTGIDPSFRQYGYLFVTGAENGAAYLEAAANMQKNLGVPVRLLTPAEIYEIAPYLRGGADILAGSFSPTDGYLDPYAVCKGFEKAARAAGAIACYKKDALGYDGKELRIRDNTSEEKSIAAKKVVLCPGQWAGETAARFGIDIPVTPEKHQLAMTEATRELPSELPMVVDLDTSFHFRREGEGLLLGYSDPHVSDSEGFDFSFLEHIAEPALRRLPILENIGFDTKKCWAGYYAETPDHHAAIGDVNNIVVAAGFGGHGVMHSPAAGLAAAELALYGESRTLDASALHPNRFAQGGPIIEKMVI